MAKKNELAIIDTERVSIIPTADEMAAIFEELSDVDHIEYGRIKIAGAGAGVFKVTDPGEEDSQTATEIVGVIILSHKCNAYWRAEYGSTEADKTPDCASFDGITGVVSETGEARACKDCPLNEYGSAENGLGKACKNMRRMYIMREGDILPMVLSLPGTALRAYDNYRTSLATKRKTPASVLTRITLKSARSKGNVEYSTPQFAAVGALPASEIARVREFAAQFEGVANRADTLAEDAERRNAGYVPARGAPTNAPTEFVEVDDAEMPF